MGIAGRQFNAARVRYQSDVLRVLAGAMGIDALLPETIAQLPLVSLWGTAARELPERWAAGKRSIGLMPNLKTLNKYRMIAADLDAVLDGRPVESLSDHDLNKVKFQWCSQGNGPSTVVCKLDLLKQLVRQLGSNQRMEHCFQVARPVGGKLKTKRRPFTQGQACAWVKSIDADEQLSADDKMLVFLLFLTAARLEELCQLTADDISSENEGWQLRIADGRDTGLDAGLKNAASARCLTIPRGALPALDRWLGERIVTGGRLFPALTTDKYGNLSSAVSKRLNRRLRMVVGADRRLVLLSSRPTVNRVMRRAGVDPRVRYRQLGHADQGIHDRHYDAAEHFDDEDLLPAATVIAAWLADCLKSEAMQGVDEQAPGNNPGLGQLDTGMSDEGSESGIALQQLPVQLDNPASLTTPGTFQPPAFTAEDGTNPTTLGRQYDKAGVVVTDNEIDEVSGRPPFSRRWGRCDWRGR